MSMTRRQYLSTMAAAPAALAVNLSERTKMRIHLSAGSIGVKASQTEAIALAAQYGYEAVDADSGYLASLDESGRKRLADELRAKNLTWGTSGLSVDFRKGDAELQASLKDFPARCAALRSVGATRITTWISPTSDSLTYLQNLKQHGERLREAAKIAGDHGCRVGLEYVGPKTSWTSRRYPFVHSMKEMRELIAEINRPNVGLVMDSWHWYTAGETLADLKTLTSQEVVSMDLNDAPAGLTVEQQVDSKRELPCATGVIDMAGFLNTLNEIGCDAPARCEPFNSTLRSLTPEMALQVTVRAMRKAFDLIKG